MVRIFGLRHLAGELRVNVADPRPDEIIARGELGGLAIQIDRIVIPAEVIQTGAES